MLILDIDGVISTDGKIAVEGVDAILNLKRKGISYTFATGRSYLRCMEIINGISPTVPLILENGSKIIYSNGETIFAYPLSNLSLQYLKLTLLLNSKKINYSCFPSLDNLKYFFYATSKYHDILKEKIKYPLIITTDVNEFVDYALENQCTQITLEMREGAPLVDNDLRF